MKKYQIIYADPPWSQKAGRPLSGGYKKKNGVQVFNPLSDKSADLPYNTMSVNEIKDIPVKDIVENDAVLFMWVTNKYLMKAEQIIKTWGFRYSTTLVWVKKPIGSGMGGTFKVSTEFLLFATRGKVNASKSVNGTWFEQKRKYVNGYPCHSKKPDFFYKLIESVFDGEKIELFAREKTEGWDVWGDEVENDIILEKPKQTFLEPC